MKPLQHHHPLEPQNAEQKNLVGGFNPSENMSQNGFIFPTVRGENEKYLSCHHSEMLCSRCFQRHGPLLTATSTTRKTGCPKLKIPSLQLAVAEPLKPKRFWQAIVKKSGFNRWDGWKMLNQLGDNLEKMGPMELWMK